MNDVYEDLYKAIKKSDLYDTSTGIFLSPSYHGEDCMGNGEHEGYECCCDECDYYLACFPDWRQFSSWQTPQMR